MTNHQLNLIGAKVKGLEVYSSLIDALGEPFPKIVEKDGELTLHTEDEEAFYAEEFNPAEDLNQAWGCAEKLGKPLVCMDSTGPKDRPYMGQIELNNGNLVSYWGATPSNAVMLAVAEAVGGGE